MLFLNTGANPRSKHKTIAKSGILSFSQEIQQTNRKDIVVQIRGNADNRKKNPHTHTHTQKQKKKTRVAASRTSPINEERKTEQLQEQSRSNKKKNA